MRSKNIRHLLAIVLALGVTTLSAQTHWTAPSPSAYSNYMSIYYSLQDASSTQVAHLEDYEVAAFVGTELRGVGTVWSYGGITCGHVNVYSNNSNGETITFKYYDTVNGEEADIQGVSISLDVSSTSYNPASPLVLPTTIGQVLYYNVTATPSIGGAGTVSGTGEKQEGTTAILTATASPGYTFVKWTDGTNDLSTESAYSFTVTKDVALTAVFSLNHHTMTFVLGNGEDDVVNDQGYGTPLTAPSSPTRTGYTFTGWLPVVPVTVPDEDKTFTAQWTINKYSVAFMVQGLSYATRSVPYGTAIVLPTSPTLTGRTFQGWTPAVPATMPAEALTFTATWDKYAIKFVNGVDGTTISEVLCIPGETVTATYPTPPAVAGKKFAEWSAEIPATMGNEDITIVANYSDFMRGDVDGDGEIKAIDASLVLQIVAKIIAPDAPGIFFEAADVDGDGEIKAIDASLILQYVANIISNF